MDSAKRELRAKIREARRTLISEFDFTLLMNSPEFLNSKVIASYRSYGDEPSTQSLNQSILTSKRILLLPRRREDGAIEFVEWNGDLQNLAINGRVEEPIGAKYQGSIDLVVVPSLAADRYGNRLGQGGGSYDRALLSLNAWRITLLNPNELLDQIPIEAHDQKIDAALLPNELIRF